MKKETPVADEKLIGMPVNKLSYSGLTQLCRNPLIFKLKYILGVYEGKVGMSGMVGKACHKALQFYNGGDPDMPCLGDSPEDKAQALEIGMKYLTDYNDNYIDFGKTGSREKMLKMYSQAMQFYFNEEPEYNEIIAVEQKLEAEIRTVDGDLLPLPAVGIPDLVHRRKDGGAEIIDMKFTKSFTDYDEEDGIKIIQSQFMWHLVKAALDVNADRMIFREVKITENSGENAGKPQMRDWVVPLNHEPYRVIFYNIYKDVTEFLKNPNAIYLPNFSDPFDKDQTWLLYAQGLISSDMSDVEVMHKVKDVALVSKKFIPSRLDKVENQHLNPEEKIKLRLAEFGIPVEPMETKVGASVTQYTFKVSAGISMNRFAKHKADIARAIEAKGEIRILAPIPGTSLVGIEVQSLDRKVEELKKEHFVKGTLMLPIGVNVQGEAVQVPLNEMPHLLIAGATGSGKSILLHAILTALTKQMTPKEMQLILIDPKRVELRAFAKAKHLRGGKIAYEYADAIMLLKGLIDEMERRYKELERTEKRDIGEYNKRVEETGINEKLPYIVCVIDEYADLIFQGKEIEKKNRKKRGFENIAERIQVEKMARQFAKMGIKFVPPQPEDEVPTADEMIVRLAAMARAIGIHLIIATQRPTVEVVTGLIKANISCRIALTVTSQIDSKIILDEIGAEKLGGKGDMLFRQPGKPILRLQGFFTK